MIKKNKLNILIDGQFGSTGKGVIASYLSRFNFDVAVTNSGANSGHTFYMNGKKCITQHLPVSGIMKDCIIYLCADSVINPAILLNEIQRFKISPDRLVIHPRAAIITSDMIEGERNADSLNKICSTFSGTGKAIISKTNREGNLACNEVALERFIGVIDLQKTTSLMEVPQGLGLSINSGLSYPYCTSREITIPSAMAAAQVHPHFLGTVFSVIRTFPIRVSNAYSVLGNEMANSGPFYEDSIEKTWDELNLTPELTTVTNKRRRIATFSYIQYQEMVRILRPDYIFLNFSNYLNEVSLNSLLDNLPEVTHLCSGPNADDVSCI